MKKLTLKVTSFQQRELLSRRQMKNVKGGAGNRALCNEGFCFGEDGQGNFQDGLCAPNCDCLSFDGQILASSQCGPK
jgi:hypothetical protein